VIAARSRKRNAPECWHIQFFCMCMIVNYFKYGGGAGVELITVLTARKLLIPGSATKAKKAPLPDPLYVYWTKILFAFEPDRPHSGNSIP
jgi:hypothetical protein